MLSPEMRRRLDRAIYYGVDAGIGAVVDAMKDLVEFGSPLRMTSDVDGRGMWHRLTRGTDLHTRRPTGVEAAAIVAA